MFTDSEIVRVLCSKQDVCFTIYDCMMSLSNFCKPSPPRSPYYRIFFTAYLYNIRTDKVISDYELFGNKWIDVINMRIINEKIEFGFLNDEELLWFPYKKNNTFPESGSGCSEPDIDDYPEYSDLDRYNDIVDHIMTWFSK